MAQRRGGRTTARSRHRLRRQRSQQRLLPRHPLRRRVLAARDRRRRDPRAARATPPRRPAVGDPAEGPGVGRLQQRSCRPRDRARAAAAATGGLGLAGCRASTRTAHERGRGAGAPRTLPRSSGCEYGQHAGPQTVLLMTQHVWLDTNTAAALVGVKLTAGRGAPARSRPTRLRVAAAQGRMSSRPALVVCSSCRSSTSDLLA